VHRLRVAELIRCPAKQFGQAFGHRSFTLVLRGEPTSSIADTLHISRHTVQDHLKVVIDKMGVHSRRDLVGRLLGATDRTSSR